ncbi:MAG: hypothetical protein LBM87_03855 [Ruminococcus sp.]|jgi:hypothetical protein|nr:hypothetical protein [Ruminococcus sp.]
MFGTLKLKRVLSAAAACFLAVTVSVTAAAESAAGSDNPTAFCFDNEQSMSYIVFEGNEAINATRYKAEISGEKPLSGAGSLMISETLTSEVSGVSGGIYITAQSLGLQSFEGCTITAKIFPVEPSVDMGAQFVMYTDSQIYIPTGTGGITAGKWNDITLTVPADCANTKLGFTIPIYTPWSGTVCYIDNITITQSDGVVVTNVGDFSDPVAEEETNRTLTLILTIVFVILVIGIVFFIVSTVIKMKNRFR